MAKEVTDRSGASVAEEGETYPIEYRVVEHELPTVAAQVGKSPDAFRSACEAAIRNRMQEAYIEEDDFRAFAGQPDILRVDLWAGTWTYFTVEPPEIVIRGFGYYVDREPYHECFLIVEHSWYR